MTFYADKGSFGSQRRHRPGHNLSNRVGSSLQTPIAVRSGGSVQQGLSAAGGPLGFYKLCLAADKRYSLNSMPMPFTRLKLLGMAAGIAPVAIILGWSVWWPLWMYHGWPGSPGWLAWLLRADGERAYDAMMDEMALICFFGLLFGCAVVRWVFAKKFVERKQHVV